MKDLAELREALMNLRDFFIVTGNVGLAVSREIPNFGEIRNGRTDTNKFYFHFNDSSGNTMTIGINATNPNYLSYWNTKYPGNKEFNLMEDCPRGRFDKITSALTRFMTVYGAPQATRGGTSTVTPAASHPTRPRQTAQAFTTTQTQPMRAIPAPQPSRGVAPAQQMRAAPATTAARQTAYPLEEKDFKIIFDSEQMCLRFPNNEERNKVLRKFKLHSIDPATIDERRRRGQLISPPESHNQLNTSPFVKIGDFHSIYFPTYTSRRGGEDRIAVDFGLDTNKQAFDRLLGLEREENLPHSKCSHLDSDSEVLYDTFTDRPNTAAFTEHFLAPYFYELTCDGYTDHALRRDTSGRYEEINVAPHPPIEEALIRQRKAVIHMHETHRISPTNNALALLDNIFPGALVAPAREMHVMSPPPPSTQAYGGGRVDTPPPYRAEGDDAPPPYRYSDPARHSHA